MLANSVSAVLLFCGAILVGFLVVSLVKKEQSESLKLFLFWGIAVLTALTTLYLAVATVFENTSSATGGPVHWHADFQIYSCGKPVKLRQPTGFSNRIGTSLLHEHGDSRIHVEGTVQNLSEISLGKFFESTGGKLTNTLLLVPTDQGDLLMQNGMDCIPNDNSNPGDGNTPVKNIMKPFLQVFVYKANEKTKTITQEKLSDFPSYVLSHESKVPPGDCIIFEFGATVGRTEHICSFYKIAINNGNYNYGD